MLDKWNYYRDILNVLSDATPKEIKESYRKLAKIYRLDISKIQNCKIRFHLINQSFEYLNRNYNEHQNVVGKNNKNKDDYFEIIDDPNLPYMPYINECGKFVDYYKFVDLKEGYYAEPETVLAKLEDLYLEASRSNNKEDVKHASWLIKGWKKMIENDVVYAYMLVTIMNLGIYDFKTDLYSILNISMYATDNQIEKALKKMLSYFENDKLGTSYKICKKFCKEVSRILLNDNLRRKYDNKSSDLWTKGKDDYDYHYSTKTKNSKSEMFWMIMLFLIILLLGLIRILASLVD